MTTEGLHDMDILSSGKSHCILYQSKAKLNMLQTTIISNGGILYVIQLSDRVYNVTFSA